MYWIIRRLLKNELFVDGLILALKEAQLFKYAVRDITSMESDRKLVELLRRIEALEKTINENG